MKKFLFSIAALIVLAGVSSACDYNNVRALILQNNVGYDYGHGVQQVQFLNNVGVRTRASPGPVPQQRLRSRRPAGHPTRRTEGGRTEAGRSACRGPEASRPEGHSTCRGPQAGRSEDRRPLRESTEACRGTRESSGKTALPFSFTYRSWSRFV